MEYSGGPFNQLRSTPRGVSEHSATYPRSYKKRGPIYMAMSYERTTYSCSRCVSEYSMEYPRKSRYSLKYSQVDTPWSTHKQSEGRMPAAASALPAAVTADLNDVRVAKFRKLCLYNIMIVEMRIYWKKQLVLSMSIIKQQQQLKWITIKVPAAASALPAAVTADLNDVRVAKFRKLCLYNIMIVEMRIYWKKQLVLSMSIIKQQQQLKWITIKVPAAASALPAAVTADLNDVRVAKFRKLCLYNIMIVEMRIYWKKQLVLSMSIIKQQQQLKWITIKGEPTMKRSRSLWTPDAEEVFIMLWEQKLPDLRGPRKNSHVYQEMAAEMKMQGYDIDSTCVKTKLDNLTAKYKKVKNAMGTTGGSPASWHLYEQVHRIIGGLVLNNVEKFVQESYEIRELPSNSPPSLSSHQLSPPSSPLPSSVSPVPSGTSSSAPTVPSPVSPLPSATSSRTSERSSKKKQIDRLVTVCEDMQKHFSQGMEQFSKSTEELVQLEKAKVAAMKDLQGDAKRLTDGVLEFLNKF